MFSYCPIPPLHANLKGLPSKNFRACGVIDTECTIFAFENSANSKQDSKRLKPVNQGPRVYCLMKKTEGQKSLDIVSLIGMYYCINCFGF
jgi:hypothetical protein